jgi:hypothetical protein
MKEIVGIILLVALVVAIALAVASSDQKDIRSWASKNGMEAVKIDTTWTDGPFGSEWNHDEDSRVYYVEFRTTGGGTKYGWARLGNGWFSGVEIRMDKTRE